MTKEEWADRIKALLENPTDRSIDRLARAVVSAIQQAEHDAFMEGKSMMQKTLDQMRYKTLRAGRWYPCRCGQTRPLPLAQPYCR